MERSYSLKRRILQVSVDPFDPPLSGADLRNDALRTSLSRLGEVTVVSLAESVKAVGQKIRWDRGSVVCGLSDASLDEIERQVRAFRPDVVVMQGSWVLHVARRLSPLKSEWDMVFIGDNHNVESALVDGIEKARHPLSALIWRLGAPWSRRRYDPQINRRAEQEFIALMDQCWVCSEADRILLQQLAPNNTSPIHIVPNPCPAWCADVGTEPAMTSKPGKMLFVGHLRYRPNMNAVRILCSEIMPELRRAVPGLGLIVAGRSPHKKVRKAIEVAADIELVVDPEDLRPLYEQAFCSVIPLREGGGTRIKVLEALAAGVPVVATAKAVEGISIKPEQDFLLAETAKDFSRQIARLSSDASLRSALIEQGRDYVRRHHSREAIHQAVAESFGALPA